VQFPYEQVQQVLMQMGIPPKSAALFIEMYKAINAGVVAAEEPRSPENTTPTSFEKFVQDVFVPACHGRLLPLKLRPSGIGRSALAKACAALGHNTGDLSSNLLITGASQLLTLRGRVPRRAISLRHRYHPGRRIAGSRRGNRGSGHALGD